MNIIWWLKEMFGSSDSSTGWPSSPGYTEFRHPSSHLVFGVPVCYQWSDWQQEQQAPTSFSSLPLLSVHLPLKAFVVNNGFNYLELCLLPFTNHSAASAHKGGTPHGKNLQVFAHGRQYGSFIIFELFITSVMIFYRLWCNYYLF